MAKRREGAAGAVEATLMRFLRRVPRQSRSRAVVDAVLVAFEERLVGGEAPEAVSSAWDRVATRSKG